MAGTHGGARPGAGRKPAWITHAGPVAEALKKIADRLPDIVDAQLDLALGALVHEVDKESGETNVYTQPPDRAAGQYLLNRVMGKPIPLSSNPYEELSDEDLLALVQEAASRLGNGGDAGP